MVLGQKVAFGRSALQVEAGGWRAVCWETKK
jgi:hypothetical protein